MSVLLLFIDGIGIGENDSDKNPFARFPSPYFSAFKDSALPQLPFDGIAVSTDPSMGVPGLPQSATGQTALLSGVSASPILGHHLSGFPSPTLRKILLAESIFLKLERLNKVGTFANAFSPQYFERPDRSISATTWSVKASKFPFRMIENDLLEGRAVSHDLTNDFLAQLGFDVPIRTPQQSADILANIVETVDFCLFEFIMTDTVGHKQDMVRAEVQVRKLTALAETLLSKIDLNRHLVILTSDHGNFEDLSVSTHTHNLVATLLWGNGSREAAHHISRIEEITPAILAHLSRKS
jgi:hypothetical protein